MYGIQKLEITHFLPFFGTFSQSPSKILINKVKSTKTIWYKFSTLVTVADVADFNFDFYIHKYGLLFIKNGQKKTNLGQKDYFYTHPIKPSQCFRKIG